MAVPGSRKKWGKKSNFKVASKYNLFERTF